MSSKSSPKWTDLLKDNPFLSQSQRKKKQHVSLEQRKVMLDFVFENPELVTHSSTKENETALWSDLNDKLNAMLPEKNVVFWKNSFKKWVTSIQSKNEHSLTLLDYELKKFLKNITANKENVDDVQTQIPNPLIKRKLSLYDIENNIKEVEAEKTKLQLEIDSMQLAVFEHKMRIKELIEKINSKKRKSKNLSVKKNYLNKKRKKIEEDNLDKN